MLEKWPKMGITIEDIEICEQRRSTPNGMRDFLIARDLEIESLLAKGIFDLYVDPESFRVWKGRDEQLKILQETASWPNYDPTMTPQLIREGLLDDVEPAADGTFVFEPSRLYLAYTKEHVSIPDTQTWRMRTYFVNKESRLIYNLTTNLTAPTLKPRSQGPQTYEIINEDSLPLVIKIQDLACPTAVFEHNPVDENSGGTFQIQSGRKPKLGKIDLS